MRFKTLKTIGLIAALTACIGMTAFAAPSPVATIAITSVAAVDASGNSVKVALSATIPEQYATAVTEIQTEAKLKEVLGDEFNANMIIAAVQDVTVPDGTTFPLDVTFNMQGVTSATKAQVLHYTGTDWEKITTETKDGAVIGKGFNSLSPVAIVVDNTTLKAGAGTTSPKTNAGFVSTAAIIGLFAVAGVFGLRRKSFAK